MLAIKNSTIKKKNIYEGISWFIKKNQIVTDSRYPID
jgi:hypothetical protein